MASATAPPTPVSISSNTSVGAEPRSASTTLSASRKRASSPPEATFISGPGRVPGLVRTQNSTRSMPCGPPASGSLAISVENVARSSLSGLSSALTALSSFSRRLAPRRRERGGGGAVALPRLARGGFERGEPLGAGIDQAEIGGVAGGERVELVDRHVVFARRPRAARTAAPRSARARADRGRRRAAPASRCARASSSAVSAASSAFTAGSISAGACAARRSSRRTAAASAGTGDCAAGHRLVRVAQIAGDLLGLHHGGAPLGERGLFRRFRREPRAAPRPRGAASRPRAARARPRRGAPRASASRARRSSHSRATSRRRRRARRRHRAARGGSRHRPARARRAGRGSRPAPRRAP